MKIISFSGIDGSGKSALTKRTETFLRSRGIRASVVEVYRKSIYITIGRIVGSLSGRMKDGIEKIHSEKGGISRPMFNFIRKACLLLDILIFRLRMLSAHIFGKVLVCDRYFFDILVHYIFINVINESEMKFFLKIIPKPAVAILLTTDEDTAQKREGDHVDRGYYEQKNSLYKVLAADLRLIIVDSSKDEDRTWAELEPIIVNGKSKRILMVSRAVNPPWDEASRNLVRDVVSYLGDYRFHILTAGDGQTWGKNVVPEAIYSDKTLRLAQKIRMLGFLFKHRARFDLYHFCFTPEPFTSLLLRNIVGRRKSVQSVPYLTENIAGSDMRSLLFSDEIVVASEHTKNALKRNGIDNVTVIYPSVDTKRFCPETDVSLPGKKADLPKGFNVLWPCKFVSDAEIKALETIAYEISRLDDNVNLVVSVRIDGKTNAQRMRVLKDALKIRGIEKRVAFIEKVEDMALLMAACDVLIYPFFSGFKKKIDIPYVIVEAMASAKPILISDKEPINEVIKLGAGMAIVKDDPAEFARAIITLYKDRGLREDQERRNREVALRYFDLSKNVEIYRTIYESLLKDERI